jgi:hypothetical protein
LGKTKYLGLCVYTVLEGLHWIWKQAERTTRANADIHGLTGDNVGRGRLEDLGVALSDEAQLGTRMHLDIEVDGITTNEPSTV